MPTVDLAVPIAGMPKLADDGWCKVVKFDVSDTASAKRCVAGFGGIQRPRQRLFTLWGAVEEHRDWKVSDDAVESCR